MEDYLNFFENGRRPYFYLFVNGRFKKIIEKIMQPETFKIKTMVVAPFRETKYHYNYPYNYELQVSSET